jgi:hypothetical protein
MNQNDPDRMDGTSGPPLPALWESEDEAGFRIKHRSPFSATGKRP